MKKKGNIGVNNLQTFALVMVMVGMLVGVGVLVQDKFSSAVHDSTSVTYQAITISSGAGTTTSNNVTAVAFFGNFTHNGTIDTTVNWTAAGAITTAGFANGVYNISYTYDQSNAATSALDGSASAIGAIGSTWQSLIITIGVLALIMGLVISGFAYMNRR